MSEISAQGEPARLDCVIVVGGKFHHMDFARLEILRHLGDRPYIRTRVFEDFECTDAIRNAKVLISYTCDVRPSDQAQQALSEWVRAGGRWFALHGTNSFLDFAPGGYVECPAIATAFIDTLGSRFVAHPPIEPYKVAVTAPDHSLVANIDPFVVTNELYLMETAGDLEVLLHVDFEGEAPGFAIDNGSHSRHPVFYVRQVGYGTVLYLSLGHCRGVVAP